MQLFPIFNLLPSDRTFAPFEHCVNRGSDPSIHRQIAAQPSLQLEHNVSLPHHISHTSFFTPNRAPRVHKYSSCAGISRLFSAEIPKKKTDHIILPTDHTPRVNLLNCGNNRNNSLSRTRIHRMQQAHKPPASQNQHGQVPKRFFPRFVFFAPCVRAQFQITKTFCARKKFKNRGARLRGKKNPNERKAKGAAALKQWNAKAAQAVQFLAPLPHARAHARAPDAREQRGDSTASRSSCVVCCV